MVVEDLLAVRILLGTPSACQRVVVEVEILRLLVLAVLEETELLHDVLAWTPSEVELGNAFWVGLRPETTLTSHLGNQPILGVGERVLDVPVDVAEELVVILDHLVAVGVELENLLRSHLGQATINHRIGTLQRRNLRGSNRQELGVAGHS